ncbi:N-formylglutamate deformylase [Ramlibacter sp.]|uniref:N-formylglutamate deformylase n=1 Tax=Ramlibacter sp. TaxID=1917967 RepID=UPI00182D2620|nr:N-formylglutamate deformylase [Ramlibacter sp.]MBA2676275.1 N-formylglutamate deformylase [Ramlibacter sp.]
MSFHLHTGSQPILVSMPHAGTDIPQDLRDAYVPRALAVEDTDWHLPLLHDWLDAMGASVLLPRHSRYVIDLNRPPDDAPMYPGASNTELCPTRFFTGDPLYRERREPSAGEKERRRALYWQPYHDALAGELARLKARHGFALLWDAHSIRSQIPWLFEGVLPDLNIGTANGASAHADIADAVAQAAARRGGCSHVVNGRFKGGYITRHYGHPAGDVHAVQLEMCQSLYMREEPPYAYDAPRTAFARPVVRDMMEAALAACKALYGR